MNDFNFFGERPDPPNFPRNEQLGLGACYGEEIRLEPVFSSALHREPLSTVLGFLVNDPLPDLQNFPRNFGLGTRYAEKILFLLKLGTCTFGSAT